MNRSSSRNDSWRLEPVDNDDPATVDLPDIYAALPPARRNDLAAGIALAAHIVRALPPLVDRTNAHVIAIALDDAAATLTPTTGDDPA